jgi:hypothetical protein
MASAHCHLAQARAREPSEATDLVRPPPATGMTMRQQLDKEANGFIFA